MEKVPGPGETAGFPVSLRQAGLAKKNFGGSWSIATCPSQRVLAGVPGQTTPSGLLFY